MFALVAFIIGLVVLFKGSFRFASRTVTQQQSRPIAFYLMAPLIVLFCASTLLLPNYVQFNNDGTFVISANAFDYISNTIGLVELIAVGVGVLLVILTIYGSPRLDGSGAGQPRPAQAATVTRVPDIMTVAEAAAYMRISEREIMSLIDQGKLGAARIGDTYRIARIAIEDFMSGA